jgi:YHS domain-containing protein
MRFLYEIFVLLLLFFLLRAVLRLFMGGFRAARNTPSSAPRPTSAATTGELKKDPVCGTYVPMAGSLTQVVNGGAVYFCSEECRDKYMAQR